MSTRPPPSLPSPAGPRAVVAPVAVEHAAACARRHGALWTQAGTRARRGSGLRWQGAVPYTPIYCAGFGTKWGRVPIFSHVVRLACYNSFVFGTRSTPTSTRRR